MRKKLKKIPYLKLRSVGITFYYETLSPRNRCLGITPPYPQKQTFAGRRWRV